MLILWWNENEAILRRTSLQLLLIFVLALALRLGVMAALGGDLRHYQTGDYDLYKDGAQDFVITHDFSNSLYLPRPPLFSLMIVAVGINDWAVIVMNVILGALAAPLSYRLARQLGLAQPLAIMAALVVAIDPTGVLFSPFLGPEPLANLLLLIGLMGVLGAVQSTHTGQTYAWAILGGLALVLSSLTRPSTYLLWVPLGLWLLLANRRKWAAIGVVALINVVSIVGWVAHNGSVFHNPTYTTVGQYTMLYYRAAAVEHQATGEDMNTIYADLNCRVETRMGRSCADVTADTRYNYHSSSPELANALQAVSFEVFMAHPVVYVITIPVGFARMYGLLPNLETLSSWLTYPFVVWNLVFLVGTLVGLWFAWRRKQYTLFWGVLIVCAYYTAGTLAVKSAGMDTRERSMLTPLMAVVWVYAVALLIERWQVRRASVGDRVRLEQ